MAEYTLSINGQSHTVEASPDMPLLWVLRDRIKLTGTKFGCGQGLCGACTVHLGGEAVRSCVTPVSDVGAKRITTIEGLDPHGAHPLQKAWIEVDVAQCGYCQTGQIMTAAALLARHPKPTDKDIDQAMGENVCRCGTYLRIREAIHRAAGQRKEVAP
ncbi:(2Fe-2S)-binding protein [Geothrix mesophila]|uniref:(2Fe-2S)-binding protein n=1 Tax=Geothrix mesophila TaxID=2922723 RepID=UPI001FAD3DA9|nr:(2Fe-2S)-binding protein [Geothrix sp. SG198]